MVGADTVRRSHRRLRDTVAMSDVKWYWDLNQGRAVTGDERGPGDNTLGPYGSRAEAENWRSTVERRNDAWDEDDDEWSGANHDDDRS